jgi:hypothetical protein
MLKFMTVKPLFVSLGLSLSLCAACSDAGGGPGGSAGGGPVDGGGSGNPGGSSSAGSSSAGTSAGGSSAAGSGASGAPSSGAGDYSSGVSGDKQLGSLSDSEFQGLCKKLSDHFSTGSVGKSVEEFTCRLAGLFAGATAETDAALKAACKSAYDQCLAAPHMTDETCTKPAATCTATVAEYDACVSDSAKALVALGNELPACAELTLSSLEMIDLGEETASPASCKVLETKCPSAPKPPNLPN